MSNNPSEVKALVKEIFEARENGDSSKFINALDDKVQWILEGTSTLSRTYSSKADFVENALSVVKSNLNGPIKVQTRNIFVDGDHAIVVWDGLATMKNGKPYNNTYCWVMQIKDGKIMKGSGFVDTKLLDELLAQ